MCEDNAGGAPRLANNPRTTPSTLGKKTSSQGHITVLETLSPPPLPVPACRDQCHDARESPQAQNPRGRSPARRPGPPKRIKTNITPTHPSTHSPTRDPFVPAYHQRVVFCGNVVCLRGLPGCCCATERSRRSTCPTTPSDRKGLGGSAASCARTRGWNAWGSAGATSSPTGSSPASTPSRSEFFFGGGRGREVNVCSVRQCTRRSRFNCLRFHLLLLGTCDIRTPLSPQAFPG